MIFFVKNTILRIISRFLLFLSILPNIFPFRLLRRLAKRKRNKIEKIHFRRYCIHLSNFVQEPVFVKVGAFDGLNDPSSDILFDNKRWKGLLIEPVPHIFNRLKANFQDSKRFLLEQVALGSTAGEATFYSVDPNANKNIPDLKHWFEKIGSLNRKHILKFFNGALEPYIVESTVKVCTLSDILKKNCIQDMHFLQIDTEGYDYEVLKTLDFANQSPVMIFIEHAHLSNAHKTEMVNLLRKYGYSVHDCGIDYFALNIEAYKKLQL